jgi:flagellar motor switch protein FliM
MVPELAARWRMTSNRRLPQSRDALVVATAALAERPLELHVELEGCELDVGALQDLQVGDVVRLAHGLDRPVCVRHAGASLCHAYIGRRGNRKAVELAGRLQPASGDVVQ